MINKSSGLRRNLLQIKNRPLAVKPLLGVAITTPASSNAGQCSQPFLQLHKTTNRNRRRCDLVLHCAHNPPGLQNSFQRFVPMPGVSSLLNRPINCKSNGKPAYQHGTLTVGQTAYVHGIKFMIGLPVLANPFGAVPGAAVQSTNRSHAYP